MAEIMGPRITALQIANDILSGYGDFSGLGAEQYTRDSMELAEIFLSWADGSEEDKISKSIAHFFARRKS